ncbi:MAG TPA: RNA 2',3'-cyclic phosphodiesterase [Longimicrobiaceae bacterium]|nr:RNA 2',3'-cyclic phosphodiesterase [Longimicrobiaceae bacterium]
MANENVGRLFLAAPVSDEVRAELSTQLRDALAGEPLPGRAVPAENWHLTLRFLGDTEAAARDRLLGELRAATLGSPFVLEFGRCGAFPRPARASVLWLGVAQGEAPLRALAAEVEDAVGRAGWTPENRPSSPHLTLSRIQPPRDVRTLLERFPPFPIGLPVEEVVLYRSRLGSGPVRYEPLERFPLT